MSVVMLIVMTLPAASPPVAADPSGWPAAWIGLATDDNECCTAFRNVADMDDDGYALYYAVDSQYIYLRMETVTPPGWPSTDVKGEARYKWWFNTAGTAASVKGTSVWNSVWNAEFLLILEDRTDTSNVDGSRDQLGELTLMDDLENISFAKRWNQENSGAYITGTPDNGGSSSLWKRAVGNGTAWNGGPQGVMGADIGYRIDNATTRGNFVDMYVSRAALGNPSSLCLIWATDNQNPNLDQAPNCDRPEEPSCIMILQEPEIELTKTATLINGTVPDPFGFSAVDDVITYEFTVKNIGNVTVYDVTVEDTIGGVIMSGGPIAELAPDQSDSTTFTATCAVTQADLDAGHFYNLATATGYDSGGEETIATAEANETVYADQEPEIELTKTASPNSFSAPGTVTYTYTVTNTGKVPLTGINVTDDKLGEITLLKTTLEPGEYTTGTASYNVTQADINARTPIVNIATATCDQGVIDTATATVTITRTPTPTPGGGAGVAVRYLTVDWDENITRRPLDRNDRLTQDLLGPSPDGKHNLFLEQGTLAPEVDGERHYLIIIRELEEEDTPPVPDNTMAVAAFNITPAGAVFEEEIILTLGIDLLPDDAVDADIFYYDEATGDWVRLARVDPNGVAELSLSAGVNHFTVFAVLVELAPPALPARFVASDLSIELSVEKIWSAVTFVTKTGESPTITANVANDGGQGGTYVVELKLNGETVDTAMVILDAGQSQQVSFTLSELDYGQYEVEVAGLSDTFTTFRTITWWLIIIIIAAIGLITWGAVWARRRRRARQQA